MFRFLLCMVSMMAVSACTGEGVSQCPVDTVPIQILSGKEHGPATTLSVATMPSFNRSGYDPNFVAFAGSSPHFQTFVTAVTEHVTARLGRDKLCLYSVRSKEQTLLQFVSWGLYSNENNPHTPMPTMPPFEVHPSFGGCRISSPWIDIAFERRPVPWIRAVARWNTRQFLADQAVLAGMQNVPTGVVTPLDSEYFRFQDEYSRLERSERYGKLIEEHIPADILWMLRNAPQRWPLAVYDEQFRISSSADVAIRRGADSYTKLVLALIDRCFASDGASLHYNNILDAADLISLEQYKIETPLFE
ncbi:MAG: hypothetical protein FWG81_04990 [Betaproteobacteria bacterium]|nr:hypothetical protein [Betaproteobacteria bacterium]